MMVGVHVVAALAGVALGVGLVYVGRIAVEGVRRDRRARPEQIAAGLRRDRWERVVEKMDSEDAAERLASFADLERYVGEESGAREDAIELTCTYLRKPFRFPVEDEGEFVIRRAAQGLLTRCLRRSGGLEHREELDLQDAVLVEPDFADCDLSGADFRDGVIAGGDFHGARFRRFANFDRVWFTGTTDFRAAAFPRFTSFAEAMFSGTTTFAEAEFEDRVDFDGARVEQPRAADSWPSPWQVWVASPVGQGRLVPRKD
ncbi:pentapeptide repeat-containing protein [Amycolatopsis thailandensis]|uniref:pentapeptide repeat-containing protein n=1 Tax=Amycolatopsis thailandensis TaxID=589330 RepID=UPI0037AACF5A